MNFDKLQEQWNQENNEVSLPQNLDKIKEAHNPIDKVRRNMKFDLISQAVLTVLIGFVPYAKRNEWDFQSISIFALFYVLMLGFMLYYTLKFYRFYKQSYNLSYDSRKNLMWFAYELRLFIELYRALTFIMMFLGMALGLYFGMHFNTTGQDIFHLKDADFLKLFGVLFFMVAFLLALVVLFMEFVINHYYGKYYKKIKNILNQLDEE
ncbi:hypothetical protein C3729_02080 [Cloacibacterium normanense]|uniref:Uncharacterized protein n=1 Tax=Cloacibacterium normanense TaxID=237258 RepID=A0A2S7I8C0_9FLAO|nr:hypothetical protein [Cloacibacterium normanense]PPZ92817.1 hypothetical protein C3729_02080 [Cloacibacterium normanense]